MSLSPRAFRRGGGGGAAREDRPALSHILLQPSQPLEEWAPPAVLQVAKALAACGIQFVGPTVTYEGGLSSCLRATQNRRYHLARRLQSRVSLSSEADPGRHSRCNWKVKESLQTQSSRRIWLCPELVYPDNMGDTVQIAWESWSNPSDLPAPQTPQDLLHALIGIGLLTSNQIGPEPGLSPLLHSNPYIQRRPFHVEGRPLRLEWATTVSLHWKVVLRLVFCTR